MIAASLLLWPTQAPAATLDWLAGSWRGSGSFLGQPTNLQLDAGQLLGGSFIEIRLAVTGTSDPFEGVAIYQTKAENNLSGVWFDNQGSMFPMVGTVSARQLVSHWKSDEGADGKSSYSLLDDGSVEVVDSIQRKDGSWQEFGRHKLSKH